MLRRRCGRRLQFAPIYRYYSQVHGSAYPDRDRTINSIVASCVPDPVPGVLNGLNVAVKDNICTKNMPTTCASNALRGFNSPFDATVVKLLRDAGASVIAKTNCDEFGMGSMNIHSRFGPVYNPFQLPDSGNAWIAREQRSAGGSSGGSAAAVAAGLCDFALATDTGGSTRLPASYCGISGHKPSYGLLSRWGVIPYADSLDCVGLMANDVSGIQRVFGILNQYDEQDPTSVSPSIREQRRLALASSSTLQQVKKKNRLTQLRVGVPQEYFPEELESHMAEPIRHILERLTSLGAQIVPVSLPSTPFALSAYYVIASAEASSNLARYDGVRYGTQVTPPPNADRTKASDVYSHTRQAGFGEEVQKRILLGTYALTADAFDNYFLQALRVRQMIRDDFDRTFRTGHLQRPSAAAQADGVDILIHPSAIRTAPLLGVTGTSEVDDYVQDILTVPASLAGLPALSVPAPTIQAGDGWPIGVSVVGQWGWDELVLAVGEVIQTSP